MSDNLERNPESPDLRSEIGQLARQPGDMGALSDWLMVNGAQHIAERYPHLGDVKAVLRSLGYEPYQVSRFMKSLARYRSVPMMGDLVTINDLRAELYRGLVG